MSFCKAFIGWLVVFLIAATMVFAWCAGVAYVGDHFSGWWVLAYALASLAVFGALVAANVDSVW